MQIKDILEHYPEQAGEILPLLETAALTRAGGDSDVPVAAMSRSRTRMLVRAEQLRRARRAQSGRISFRRLALQILGVLVVLGASLSSLFAVSAETLPGDSLYRLKLFSEEARLSAARPNLRPSLEEAFRARRIDEIQRLVQLRRAAPVTFEGVVTGITAGTWQIGGLDVSVSPETTVVGDILPGMFVEVQGQTLTTGEIRAVNIYLRSYAFVGVVEATSGQIWVVNDTPVLIQPETQLAPGITVGTQVVVLAQVDNAGTISARAVLLADGAPGEPEAPDLTGAATPSATPDRLIATVTPTPDDGTPEPVSTGDDNENEFEHTEEPEDTEKPEETETPEATEEPDDDSSNSGSGSSNSGSGSSNSGSGSSNSGSGSGTTEVPDDD